MNKQQKAYSVAEIKLKAAEAVLKAREKSFLKLRGRPESCLYEIDDDQTFDALLIEFYEDPEIVNMADDIEAHRTALNTAEDELIEYALSIAPAGLRETLRRGAATRATIRKELIQATMKLDTETVPKVIV